MEIFRLFFSLATALALFQNFNAYAASPKWELFSDGDVRNIDEPGFARASDGTLHVIWRIQSGANASIRHRSISSSGSKSGISTALTGFAGLSNPVLTVNSDGTLRAFFGAIGISESAGNGGLLAADANASGASWTLRPDVLSNSRYVYASDISVAGKDTSITSIWAYSGGVFVHSGFDSLASHEFSLDQSGCCGYSANIGIDASSGQIVAGWYSNASSQAGLYTQTVSPLIGARQYVPDSAIPNQSGNSLSIDGRMPISGRIGAAGVYVAFCNGYPTCKSVRLWRVGNSKSSLVAESPNVKSVNIAKAPDGKIWLMWIDVEKGVVYATRSNSSLSAFEPLRSIKRPDKGSMYKVSGEGSAGSLDLFLNAGNTLNYYHARLLPVLSLSASPKKAKKGKKLKFTVTDAGTPISGVSIKAFGKKLKSNAAGQASVKVPFSAQGSYGFKATLKGYADSSTLKVRVL